MSEQAIANKKPVYTITENDFQDAERRGQSWRRDNIEPWGNGRITMGAAHIGLDIPVGKNTLNIGIVKHPARTAYWDDASNRPYPYETWEVTDATLTTPDGDEFMPADLIDRIEIEGYRRVWSGVYVAADDLDWMTAGEACKRFSVSSATVRQAINREIEKSGEAPSWARKSGGTWMVKADEAEKRWGNRK